MNQQELINLIWSIANKLRGPYRPPQYRKVMIPLTVLRRLDCVLEPTKEKVLAEYKELKLGPDGGPRPAISPRIATRLDRFRCGHQAAYTAYPRYRYTAGARRQFRQRPQNFESSA